MAWGNYTWEGESFPCLSNPNRSQSAKLHVESNGDVTASYVGWHFTYDDGQFNNFMYHDVSIALRVADSARRLIMHSAALCDA
jgi:hypothetical protein